jgi:hypothetical protein
MPTASFPLRPTDDSGFCAESRKTEIETIKHEAGNDSAWDFGKLYEKVEQIMWRTTVAPAFDLKNYNGNKLLRKMANI